MSELKFESHRKAIEAATKELGAQGIIDPALKPFGDLESHLKAMDEYRTLHATKVVNILKSGVTARPLVLDNVAPKRQWGRSYYDD